VKRRDLAVALIFWGLALSVMTSVPPLHSVAQSPNRAGLVVGKGDGSLVTRCVEFAEEELSGYDLLIRSGLQVVATQSGGMGVLICEIDGQGCPASNCWCKCSGSTCTYWSYWHLDGGEWSYAFMGALSRRVRSGDVDGWMWGVGDPPPALSFEQICALPVTLPLPPTVTPTILPAHTPTLTATTTAPAPTHTPRPAGTATTLPTAIWTPTASLLAESSTLLPSATPTGTATLQAPTMTPSPTPSPQSVAAQRVTHALPTTMLAQATTAVNPRTEGGRSNYILFGVLVAILLGVMIVIVLQRKG
jgi:hypothetical protein